jgi:Mitotic-spindle organizing gamma-tubulin ring associated
MTPSDDAQARLLVKTNLQVCMRIRSLDLKVFNLNPHSSQVLNSVFNTGLSNEALEICVRLCELGVNPSSLAEIILQIRREMGTINN